MPLQTKGVQCWNLAEWKPIPIWNVEWLVNHRDASRDGNLYAEGGEQVSGQATVGRVIVRRLQPPGTLLDVRLDEVESVVKVALSPDGKQLAVVGSRTESGKLVPAIFVLPCGSNGWTSTARQ